MVEQTVEDGDGKINRMPSCAIVPPTFINELLSTIPLILPGYHRNVVWILMMLGQESRTPAQWLRSLAS